MSRSNDEGPFIHETAIVEDGAVLGTRSKVWHHAQVRGGAQVGQDCVLGKNVFIDQRVQIGDRVKIQNNVSVYEGVELEDDVFIGPSAVFTNDLVPRASSKDWTLSRTIVRRGASIGANATIVAGIEIGESALIGAGAVVTRDVPPYQILIGNPGRAAGWLCACGETRLPLEASAIECSQCDTRMQISKGSSS